MKYKLNDIYPTVQGEGCNTGTPMTVVRLHGCGVGCSFCDTKETWLSNPKLQVDSIEKAIAISGAWCEVTAEEIADYACELPYGGINWVMLTGGEPAEQDLSYLCDALHRLEFKVALETSGTALGHVASGADWVCISPKIDMPGGKAILREAVLCANEMTWVVGKEKDLENLTAFLTKHELPASVEVCLQPMSQNKKATELCIETCMQTGWRLSAQMHKYLELR